MEETRTASEPVFNPKPVKEHEWLHKLVGEWTYEADAPSKEGEPPAKATGTEVVRSLGGLWVVAEGSGSMPDGTPATSIMTLGYDPQKKRFVGTWVGTMMTHLWIYEGELDESERILTLKCEGPSMSGEEGMKQYRDVIEFISDDHRLLRGQLVGDDGKLNEFMTAHYRRR